MPPRAHLPREGVNWFRVLVDLSQLGYSVADVGRKINLPRTTIVGWRNGAEPRFGDGEKLLRLWIELSPPDAAVPMVGRGCAVESSR